MLFKWERISSECHPYMLEICLSEGSGHWLLHPHCSVWFTSVALSIRLLPYVSPSGSNVHGGGNPRGYIQFSVLVFLLVPRFQTFYFSYTSHPLPLSALAPSPLPSRQFSLLQTVVLLSMAEKPNRPSRSIPFSGGCYVYQGGACWRLQRQLPPRECTGFLSEWRQQNGGYRRQIWGSPI